MLLSDTVGFIRNLPHSLVASFHATLAEVESADLLLHVVDASAAQPERRRSGPESYSDGKRAATATVYGTLHVAPLPSVTFSRV